MALDTRALASDGATGVGRYIQALINRFQERDDLRLITEPALGPRFLGPQLLTPLAIRAAGAQLLHGPANSLPLIHPGLPGVVTIHDLAIYDHPEWFPAGQWFATRVIVPRSIRGARTIICPSTATRDAVVRLFAVPAARCRIIPHGVEPEFALPVSPAVRDAVKTRYGLPERYLLQVGTIQPRKNYLTTVRALARLAPDERIPLVVVGGFGWKYDPVVEAVRQLELTRWVRFVGYAPLPDLPALYQLAQAVTFPSLDEGFGLPVLEAFAAGTPVIGSTVGAIPEVAGEAALLVEPEDDMALAENLRRILRNSALRERQIAAGRARAGLFTWSASAAAHREVYASVAG